MAAQPVGWAFRSLSDKRMNDGRPADEAPKPQRAKKPKAETAPSAQHGPRVIVVGAGLAGLAAGIRLLEERPGAAVTLYTMGHHLGGKATSYPDEAGWNIDHGFHSISTNYCRLLDLLDRSGVDRDETLVLDRGTYYYDDRTQSIGTSAKPPDDRAKAETKKMAAFFFKNLATIYLKSDIEQFDDACWRAWTIEHGLDEALTRTRSFRFSQDALFNWPHEVSAYITMKSLRLLGGSGKYYLVDGTYGDQVIQPIVDYFHKLGGRIERMHKLIEVLHDGRRVTGLRFAMPDFTVHDQGRAKWGRSVRVLAGRTKRVDDFDHVVLTVPLDNLRELNPGDRGFWRGFPGIENLRSVATLSFQVWTARSVLPEVAGCINCLDEPLPMVVDYKQLKSRYRDNKNIGSALEWVGQETGFEELSDEEIKTNTYEAFLKIPEAKDPREAGVLHESFNRNTSNHERYLLTEPGTLKFRPRSTTNFDNLFLAGDWIRNEVDVPTMEGAVCSGYTAVDDLLKTT